MSDELRYEDTMSVVMQELFGLTYEDACQQAAERNVYRRADMARAMTQEADKALDTVVALAVSALRRNLNHIQSADEALAMCRNIARVYRLSHGDIFQLWKDSDHE